MKFTSFDAHHAVVKEIRPVVIELRDLCRAHDVPVVVLITDMIEERTDDYDTNMLYMCEGKLGKMSLLQRAFVMLEELPKALQQQLIEAIMLAAEATRRGGGGQYHPQRALN